MNQHRIIILFLLVFCTSCGKLSTTRPFKAPLPKISNLETKDLSKLSTEEAIKTKYEKIEFLCSGIIEHEISKDGVLTKESKSLNLFWDIKENTILNKSIKNDTILSLLIFNLEEQLVLKMDEKFNTSIVIAPKYEIKVFAEDGVTVLQMIKNHSNKLITLNENQKGKILDIVLDSQSNQAGTKVSLECHLKTNVYDIYKAKN